MTSNLTRFYLEPSTGLQTDEDDWEEYSSAVVQDIETLEADAYEKSLQQKSIDYIRVDL
jgi:hypothetical protein